MIHFQCPNYLYSAFSLVPHLHFFSYVSRAVPLRTLPGINFNFCGLLVTNRTLIPSIFSTGSPSDSQFKSFLTWKHINSSVLSDGSNTSFGTIASLAFWMYNCDCKISGMSLLRTQGNFRLLSTSSQDPPSSASVEHSVVNESFEFDDLVEDRNFELESLRTADLDESPSKLGHMPYINMDYIIDTIRRDEKNIESRLNLIGTSLRKFNVIEIFQVLNRDRLPALRFFYWIRNAHPKLYGNHDVCSLMFDNCWRLREYKTMLLLLEDFQSRKICLTDKAFGFLALLSSQKVIMAETVKKLLKILDEVGGPCRSSGIHSLIKMLCALNLFDMAKLIIETTETKASYYNILVREKCIRGQLKDIRCILDEMREKGCEPAAITYNYLISSLCKHQGSTIEAYQVLDEMLERGCSPNALTFEVLIYCSCGLGNLDTAIGFYDQMVSRGIEPRLSTHAAFIKGYFYSQQYEAAYNYVVGSSMKHKPSTNWIYSLLASLHQKKGDLIVAHKILVEMIEKGLKPQHSVYTRILKRLRKTGREHLARNLEARFRSLVYQSSSYQRRKPDPIQINLQRKIERLPNPYTNREPGMHLYP